MSLDNSTLLNEKQTLSKVNGNRRYIVAAGVFELCFPTPENANLVAAPVILPQKKQMSLRVCLGSDDLASVCS